MNALSEMDWFYFCIFLCLAAVSISVVWCLKTKHVCCKVQDNQCDAEIAYCMKENDPPLKLQVNYGSCRVLQACDQGNSYIENAQAQEQIEIVIEQVSNIQEGNSNQIELIDNRRNCTDAIHTLSSLDKSVQIFYTEVVQGINPDVFFSEVNHTIDAFVNIPTVPEASIKMGQMTTTTRNAQNAHGFAYSAVKSWCSLVEGILPEYLEKLQAQDVLTCGDYLEAIFDESLQTMEKVAGYLKDCRTYLEDLIHQANELSLILHKSPAVGALENGNDANLDSDMITSLAHSDHVAISVVEPLNAQSSVVSLNQLVVQVKDAIDKLQKGSEILVEGGVVEKLYAEVNNPTGWQSMDAESEKAMIDVVKKLNATCSDHQLA